jgi:flagellar basal-body rod protein FlgG
MIKAMFNSATGMKAQSLAVDVISNNLANVNTTGFKRSHLDFQDLIYATLQQPGASTAQGIQAPNGFQIGSGTRAASTTKVFTEGRLEATFRSLDVAIEGDGFLRVTLPNGDTAYTRNGSLQLDANLNIVTPEGYPVEPRLTIPNDVIPDTIRVGEDGTLSVTTAGSPDTSTEVGQLLVSRFVNPAGLSSLGGNLYRESSSSGTATEVVPGEEGTGRLRQGFLEGSNVDVVTELVKLIVAQRAYEINSRAIRASDQMLQVTNSVIQ